MGRKRRLSVARPNAWAGGMIYRDSVSLTPLIQVFQGHPFALRPLNLVLYARWAGCWIGSLVRCPNHLILCCWIWWWMLFVPTISLILVLGSCLFCSCWQLSLRIWSVFNQTNTGTISRANFGRLLREGVECIWAFPNTMMPSWAETETEPLSQLNH